MLHRHHASGAQLQAPPRRCVRGTAGAEGGGEARPSPRLPSPRPASPPPLHPRPPPPPPPGRRSWRSLSARGRTRGRGRGRTRGGADGGGGRRPDRARAGGGGAVRRGAREPGVRQPRGPDLRAQPAPGGRPGLPAGQCAAPRAREVGAPGGVHVPGGAPRPQRPLWPAPPAPARPRPTPPGWSLPVEQVAAADIAPFTQARPGPSPPPGARPHGGLTRPADTCVRTARFR